MYNKIIAIANQKGGVGKTTTTANLGAALSMYGKTVLMIDLDPQGNLTTASGINKKTLKHSSYDVLIGNVDIDTCIVHAKEFDVVASNSDLAGAEIELTEFENREFILSNALKNSNTDKYDFILIDCPPSLSLITINGLIAANLLIVPVQCEYYALEGLTDLMTTISRIKEQLNPELIIFGILRTMFDGRNRLSHEVSKELQKHFGRQLFNTIIPRTVRLAEAPSYGQSAVELDPSSSGARSHMALATEIIGRLM